MLGTLQLLSHWILLQTYEVNTIIIPILHMGKQDNFIVDCMILKYLLLFPALLKPGLAVWFAWTNKYDRSDVNHFWRETLSHYMIPPFPFSFCCKVSMSHPDRGLFLRLGTRVEWWDSEWEIKLLGLPWWSSGKESALQCRGRRFNPWSGS